jgi:hypothetical protein
MRGRWQLGSRCVSASVYLSGVSQRCNRLSHWAAAAENDSGGFAGAAFSGGRCADHAESEG